jgi:hypothetical protein
MLAKKATHNLHEAQPALGIGRRDEVLGRDQRTHRPSSPWPTLRAPSNRRLDSQIAAPP